MTRFAAFVLALLSMFLAMPGRADKPKPAPAPKTAAAPAPPPPRFTDVDFARLQLAQAKMDDADKAFALAQRALADAQRVYAEAQRQRDALLAKYGTSHEEVRTQQVKISDDGMITRASAPPAPPPKK